MHLLKKQKKIIVSLLTIMAILISNVTITSFAYENSNSINKNKGMFSWNPENVLIEQNSNELLNDTQKLNVNTIYQYIESWYWTNNKEDIKNYVSKLRNANIEVFYLIGDPTWFTSPNTIIQHINYLVNYNNSVAEVYRIKGVVLDIEPYIASNWNDYTSASLFNTYTNTMEQVYNYTKQQNVFLLQCIPYWYDLVSLNTLERLIANGSDGICVMNYWKSAVVEHISHEMNFSIKHNKYITSIAEFNPVNSYIPEDITYVYDGLDACINDWGKIAQAYSYDKLSFDFHHYAVLKAHIQTIPATETTTTTSETITSPETTVTQPKITTTPESVVTTTPQNTTAPQTTITTAPTQTTTTIKTTIKKGKGKVTNKISKK